MATETYQVVVYGSTWCAANAAMAAAEQGCTVALVMERGHIGGIMTNGLSAIDYGAHGTNARFSWLAQEFFWRNQTYFGTTTFASRTWPGAMENIVRKMLHYYGVYIRSGKTLTSVTKAGTTVSSITDQAGDIYAATVFIDGTDEGDLAAMAGVTMVTGAEAAATYGESLAGYRPNPLVPNVDCYLSSGVLLPGVNADPGLAVGAATAGIQSYTFRLCLTKDSRNKLAWPKPAGYNPLLFEFRRRASPTTDENWIPFSPVYTFNGKTDINGDFGTGSNWAWPTQTPAQRTAYQTALYNEQAGWYWFLANDSSIPQKVRDYVNSWGLCRDEFTDGNAAVGSAVGWPRELYAREGRRMVGQYVMKQSDLQFSVTQANTISVGYYSIDMHNTQACASGNGYFLDSVNAGDSTLRQVVPYEIPWTCILPQVAQTLNLLVPNAASASHVAMASMRIDLHKANVGTVAGYAAATAVLTATPINSLNVATMQAYLVSRGHPIHYP